MKKYKILIVIAILFVIGVFSITISTGNFFFATKYYKTPIEAYNSNSTYDAILGDTSAKIEVGILMLDDDTCIFIGEIDENCFVADEMSVKDNRYASKGYSIFYNLREESDGMNKNSTKISNGYVEWAVLYSQEDVDKLLNVDSTKIYTLTTGDNIYVVLYK